MMFENEIADLIAFAENDYYKMYEGKDLSIYKPSYSLRAIDNQKFIKIVEVDKYTGKDSRVWGFISKGLDGKFKAGDLLKSANWNTPAKNFARGNVTDPSTWKVRWTGI